MDRVEWVVFYRFPSKHFGGKGRDCGVLCAMWRYCGVLLRTVRSRGGSVECFRRNAPCLHARTCSVYMRISVPAFFVRVREYAVVTIT